MADRVMIQGDTYPPLRGEVQDEAGNVIDLTTASAMSVRLRAPNPSGGFYLITGTPIADTPPIADADGVHRWNWHYNWAPTDTANLGTYNVELKATFSSQVQTFTGPTLQIIAGAT